MNVLVTGGTGFIGHNVVLDLLEWTDWDFMVLDLCTGVGDPAKLVDDSRFDKSRVQVIKHDLTKPLDAFTPKRWKLHAPPGWDNRTWPTWPTPDIIINLASNSHVDNSILSPEPFIRENVAIMTTMMEFARWARPKLFIQFSTDEVYGPAPEGVNFKEWSTILPSNPYSASKAAQEAIAISYWRTYEVPVVIVNTMNVIGRHQYPEKFAPKIVENLLAGTSVEVHAQWVQDHDPMFCVLCKDKAFRASEVDHKSGHWEAGSRHYTYVSNVSNALKFLVERAEVVGVQQYGQSGVDRPERFNIVGDREVSNDEMVRLIADILGVDPLIRYVDFHSSRPGHDRRYALDGSALKGAGWEPPVPFEEGLRITVEDSVWA